MLSNFLRATGRWSLVTCSLLLITSSAFAYSMVQPSALLDHRISLRGIEYFPLKKVADYHRLSLEWDSLTQKVTLYKDGKYLSLIVGEPFYLLNDAVQTFEP